MKKLMSMDLQYFAEPEEEKDLKDDTVEQEKPDTEEKPKDPEKQPEGEQDGKDDEKGKEEEKPKEPEKESEPKKADPVEVEDNSVEVAKLHGEVESLTEQVRLEQETSAKYAIEVERLQKVVDDLVEERVKAIPEEFAELVPEGDSVDKLAWLVKADKKGLFTKGSPEIEIGRNLNTGKDTEQNGKEITAYDRLTNIFGQRYSN